MFNVRALDGGGMIFEKDGCSSLAEAMAALEKGLGKWFQENGLMDPKTVRKLEKKVTEAMADVIGRLGLKRLPMLPSHRTLEMMAKAAVAVYEVAEESSRSAG